MARPHLGIGAQRHHDLLVVPLHDVERQLDQLLVTEVASKLELQCLVDHAGLRHQGVGES